MQRNQPTAIAYISSKSIKEIYPKLILFIVPTMRYKIFVN